MPRQLPPALYLFIPWRLSSFQLRGNIMQLSRLNISEDHTFSWMFSRKLPHKHGTPFNQSISLRLSSSHIAHFEEETDEIIPQPTTVKENKITEHNAGGDIIRRDDDSCYFEICSEPHEISYTSHFHSKQFRFTDCS